MNRLLFFCLFLLVLISCEKEKKVTQDEEYTAPAIANINKTTVTIVSEKDSNNTTAINAYYNNEMNDMPDSTVVTGVPLFQNAWYRCNVHFYTNTSNGLIDRTSEINKNGTCYQFFFEAPYSFLIDSFQYLDIDKDGLPIGLDFRFKLFPWSDTLTLAAELRYKLNKGLPNVAKGKIDSADGNTVLKFRQSNLYVN